MAVHHTVTALTAERLLPAGLEALSSPAVAVLNEHVSEAGLGAVCECARLCELVILADHNLEVL